MSNESTRKTEHGIVERAANIVKIGNTSFRIPSEAHFDVRTEGVMEVGHAERLILYVNVADLMKKPPAEKSETLGPDVVRVEIRSHVYHPGNSIFTHMENLDAPRIRDELGLVEYPITGGGGVV